MYPVEEWMAEKCPDQAKEIILSKTYNDLSCKDVALKRGAAFQFSNLFNGSYLKEVILVLLAIEKDFISTFFLASQFSLNNMNYHYTIYNFSQEQIQSINFHIV